MRHTPTLIHILLLIPVCLVITIILAAVREPTPEKVFVRGLKTFGVLAGAMLIGAAVLVWLGKLI